MDKDLTCVLGSYLNESKGVIVRAIAIALISLITASVRGQGSGAGKPSLAPPAVMDKAAAWAAAHATLLATYEPGSGFDDLQPLKRIIGSSPVVAFGEAKHDTHQFLALRNRLFEFLVEQMGFTALAVETGYSESLVADDYVLGRTGDRRKAVAAAFSWSNSPSEENAQLLDWMKSYNDRSSTKRAVRFYGMDLTGGRNGTFPVARLAVDGALQYLATVDRERSRQLHRVLDSLLDRFNTSGYTTLSEVERNEVSGALADMLGAFERERTQYIARSSSAAYHRGCQNAVVARQLDENFRAQTRVNPQPRRNASMARNLRWISEQEGPSGRILVFAHNSHVKKRPEPPRFADGQYLADFLGERMTVIGSLFVEAAEAKQGVESESIPSSPPLTLKIAFWEGVRKPLFLLDLASLPREGPLAGWLASSEPASGFDENPARAFDLLVVVETVSPRRPLE